MQAAGDFDLRGRGEALAALREQLASACAGRGRLVIITGEAGIGKSALVDALARDAAQRGAAVVCGRAWEFSDAPPYFPLWPCLRSLGVELHPAGRARAPFELWDAVLSALASATSATPAVWIIDDLHVADVLTLDLLAFLARPINALRVLIAVTARFQDHRLGEPAMQRLARMTRDGLELRLGPLALDDVAELVKRFIGRAPSAALLARLMNLTGGNPLFVTECARAIGPSSEDGDGRLQLPVTLRQAILERLGLLPAPGRDTLTTAAVVGREFTAALVARIAAAPPARILDHLSPALRAGLIDEVEPGRFSFRHVLVRDALEEAAGAEAAGALHARVEQALSAEGASPELLVERARHALAGASLEDASRALALATRAADWLEAQEAFDRAYGMHRRIEGLRRAGLLPPASPEANLALARLARKAQRHGDVLRICDQVAAHARATGDAALLGHAAWARGADLRPGVVNPALVAVLEEALAASPDDQPDLRCRLLARLAAARQPAPDELAPVAMAREAIAQARRLADDEVMRDVLYFAGAAMVNVAPIEERLATSRELLERSLRANQVGQALRAHARLAVDRVELADFAGFDEDVERMLELSSTAGQASHRWRPLLFASMRAQMYGQFNQSERCVMEAAELTGLTDDPALGLSLAAHRMRRARLMHHDEETRAGLREYEDAMQGIPRSGMVATVFRLGCWARMGDTGAVTAALEQLGAQDDALWLRGFHAWLAEAYALAGTDEQRRRARAFFAPAAGRQIVVSHVALTYEGPTLRLLGLLDASLGDFAAAEEALRRAIGEARTRGHRPWVAQLRHDLATVLLQAGRRTEASALFADSAALARELGMEGLARRAGDHATGGPVTDHRADAARPPRLRLVAQGEVWRIEYEGEAFIVRDSRGMRLLARLVERPREEIHVLALASDEGSALAESHAGEMLDQRARQEYRRRLAELAGDLADAEANADLGRVAKLGAEKDILERELFRALGIGGRARHAHSLSERARVNVQRRLKDALARLAEVAPAAAHYLSGAVRTGTYCSFRP